MAHKLGFSHRRLGEFNAMVTVTVAMESGLVESSYYNLGDRSGDHLFGSRYTANAELLQPELRAMRLEAMADAQKKRVYSIARRRDTPIENLRYAFLVSQGRGGHTIWCDEDPGCESQIQGYGLTPEELAEIDRLRIPYVDTRTIPDKHLGALLALPIWPPKPHKADPAPWGGLSYAPIEVLGALHEKLGAIVRNITCRMPRQDEIRPMKSWEAACLRAFLAGDEVGVGLAMQAAREEDEQ